MELNILGKLLQTVKKMGATEVVTITMDEQLSINTDLFEIIGQELNIHGGADIKTINKMTKGFEEYLELAPKAPKAPKTEKPLDSGKLAQTVKTKKAKPAVKADDNVVEAIESMEVILENAGIDIEEEFGNRKPGSKARLHYMKKKYNELVKTGVIDKDGNPAEEAEAAPKAKKEKKAKAKKPKAEKPAIEEDEFDDVDFDDVDLDDL